MKDRLTIASLTKNDMGLPVTYHPRHGGKVEHGQISSWNDRFVFVIYDGQQQSKATCPQDLSRQY